VTGTGPVVLVAEDEPLASLALRAQLEALGYRVVGPARDGDEAVALGACFPAEIALFDFRMPRRNGLDAAVALFDIAPTPVVLLSGWDSNSLPEPIPRPPIFASLTKPADMADLSAALTRAADAFLQWLAAQPERETVVLQGRRDRATIARAVAQLTRDSETTTAKAAAAATVAERLLEQAARENRSLVDIARQCLEPAD
jgi:two-component system, response regulator PdtaR